MSPAARARLSPLREECSGDSFEVAWETMLPHRFHHLARCGELLLVSMTKGVGEGALMLVCPSSGQIVRRAERLPRLDKLAAAHDGWCLAFYRERAELPTHLHFFD